MLSATIFAVSGSSLSNLLAAANALVCFGFLKKTVNKPNPC